MMHSHFLVMEILMIIATVLILVVMDDALALTKLTPAENKLRVLILVVMDDALALF